MAEAGSTNTSNMAQAGSANTSNMAQAGSTNTSNMAEPVSTNTSKMAKPGSTNTSNMVEPGSTNTSKSAEEAGSINFQWKIRNFSKRCGRKIYSDKHSAQGRKWRLIISPGGSKGNGLVSLEFANPASLKIGKRIEAKFTVSVVKNASVPEKVNVFDKNASNTEKVTDHVYFSSKQVKRCPMTIPLGEIKDPMEMYISNDTLTLEAEISFKLSEDPSFKEEEDSRKLQEDLKNLHQKISQRNSSSFSSPCSSSSSSSTNNISAMQLKTEALEGFLNMSLEAIHEAKAFPKIKTIIGSLIKNTEDFQKKTRLEILDSEFNEFANIVPDTQKTLPKSQEGKTHTEDRKKVDLSLTQKYRVLRYYEETVEKISNELNKAVSKGNSNAQMIQGRKRNFIENMRKANGEARKDLVERKGIQTKIDDWNAKFDTAKVKLALANDRWKRFNQDLGLGKSGCCGV